MVRNFLKKVGGDLKFKSKMLFHYNRNLGSKISLHQNQELMNQAIHVA
jgi:hypothetical protein